MNEIMLKFDIKMRKIYVHSPFNIDKELDEFGEHFNFEWEGLPILNTLSRRKTHADSLIYIRLKIILEFIVLIIVIDITMMVINTVTMVYLQVHLSFARMPSHHNGHRCCYFSLLSTGLYRRIKMMGESNLDPRVHTGRGV